VRYEVQDFDDGETVIESDLENVRVFTFCRRNFVCAIKIDGARRKPEHSRNIRDLLDYVLDLLRLNRDEVKVIIGKRNFMLSNDDGDEFVFAQTSRLENIAAKLTAGDNGCFRKNVAKTAALNSFYEVKR
jgi:hypothetical protein